MSSSLPKRSLLNTNAKNPHNYPVFLDLKKAFDIITHQIPRNRLHKCYQSYLSNREENDIINSNLSLSTLVCHKAQC